MVGEDIILTIVGTVVIGVLAQVLSERTKLPSIIFLLTLGVISGPDVLHIVEPSLLGKGLFLITFFSIAIILFEGGLNLNIKNVLQLSRSVIYLITVGALITWAGGAVLARLFLGTSWKISILFGTLVIVTGPTVIGPLLRTVKVKKDVRTILKWEGILIDPVGAIIAVLALGFVTAEEPSIAGSISGFVGRIAFGAVLGLVGGFMMSRLMKIRHTESISTLLIFAVVFLIFGVSELLIRESGIMSVTIAGIVMGNMKVPNLNLVKGFKEKITILLVSVLFILLAANLRLQEILNLGWGGFFVVAGLILVIRPLNIFVSVREKNITFRDRIFLSLTAPRGIIAAAVASLFSISLAEHSYPDPALLTSMTFVTIAVTVALSGFLAKPLAKVLKVYILSGDGVLVLGGNNIALGMADQLNRKGINVAILDANLKNCEHAEMRDIRAFHGDVMDDMAWDSIDLTAFGSFIAFTSNNELNSLACIKAAQFFHRGNIYQVRDYYPEMRSGFTLEMIPGNQHYDLALDVEGIHEDIAEKRKYITTVDAVSFNESRKDTDIVLCGIKKNDVIFSTDHSASYAEELIVITG